MVRLSQEESGLYGYSDVDIFNTLALDPYEDCFCRLHKLAQMAYPAHSHESRETFIKNWAAKVSHSFQLSTAY